MEIEVSPTHIVVLALTMDEMAVLVGAVGVANQMLNDGVIELDDPRHGILSDLNAQMQERFGS